MQGNFGYVLCKKKKKLISKIPLTLYLNIFCILKKKTKQYRENAAYVFDLLFFE